MSKKVFLKKLGKALGSLPKDERAKTLSYYDELIEDRIEEGLSEEAAVAAMGDINDIANEIIADAKERGVELKNERGGGSVKALSIILVCVSVIAVLVVGGLFAVKALGLEMPVMFQSGGEWREVKCEYAIADGKTVSADLSTCDVFWGTSEDDKVHITYYENDIVKFEVSETGKGVEIVQKEKPRLFGSFEKKQTIVLVPGGFKGAIVSSVTTGETRLDNISSSVTLDVRSTTGNIIVYDLKVLGAGFGMTTGKLIMGRCSFDGQLTVTGTTGDVDIGNTESESIKIKGTTLDVKLVSVTAGDVQISCTTGNIELETVTAGSADLQATTGHVTFSAFEANDIRIKTSTGRVSGTLSGSIVDYTVRSSVSTGKNSLPESFGNGAKKLDVTTTTGDIAVYFADNQ